MKIVAKAKAISVSWRIKGERKEWRHTPDESLIASGRHGLTLSSCPVRGPHLRSIFPDLEEKFGGKGHEED
jgi:hypothetical protein